MCNCGKSACNCNSHSYNPCYDPCTDQGCPINLDADCVFYKLTSTTPSRLTCVGIPNGTNLRTILEEFDNKLCSITTLNYSVYDLSCLRDSYSILTNQQFAEAVAREICLNKTNLTTVNNTLTSEINLINTTLETILVPNLLDNCLLGIETTDTLSQILQKILNKFCEILNINYSDQSPILNAISTNTINFVTSGTKNHNILATVKISADAGNVVEARGNGIYVPSSVSGLQLLSYNAGTRTITLSGGGGTVTLPVDNDSQTLSFNTLTKILTISNGNAVDLSSLSASPTETFITANDTTSVDITASGTSNHTISAVVKISASVGNQVSIQPDGLFVPEGSVIVNDTLINTILTEIDGDSILKAQLYSIIVDSICFKFRLKNTGGAPANYDYTDCSGNLTTAISLGAGASIDITGKSVATTSPDIQIYNLGLN